MSNPYNGFQTYREYEAQKAFEQQYGSPSAVIDAYRDLGSEASPQSPVFLNQPPPPPSLMYPKALPMYPARSSIDNDSLRNEAYASIFGEGSPEGDPRQYRYQNQSLSQLQSQYQQDQSTQSIFYDHSYDHSFNQSYDQQPATSPPYPTSTNPLPFRKSPGSQYSSPYEETFPVADPQMIQPNVRGNTFSSFYTEGISAEAQNFARSQSLYVSERFGPEIPAPALPPVAPPPFPSAIPRGHMLSSPPPTPTSPQNKPLGPRKPPVTLSSPEKKAKKPPTPEKVPLTEADGTAQVIGKLQNKTVLVSNTVRRLEYAQLMRESRTQPEAHPLMMSNTWSERHNTTAEAEIAREAVSVVLAAIARSETKRALADTSSPVAEYIREEVQTALPLDLPSLPFLASSLTDTHLKHCFDLWSLLKLFDWCKNLKFWFNAPIPKEELTKALVMLVRRRYSRLSIQLIEDNVEVIETEFLNNGCMTYETVGNDVYVELNPSATISGVMTQLSLCYLTKYNHRKTESNKALKKGHACYLTYCPREPHKAHQAPALHQITTPTAMRPDGTSELGADWVDHWHVTKEELQETSESTQKRQFHIFDLIKAEQRVVNRGRIIVEVYGDSFVSQRPPLLDTSDKFYEDAFLTVIPIVEIHRKYLLEPMVARLRTTKYISSITDLYLTWIHEAYVPYLKYVDRMVDVRDVIDHELKVKKTLRFATWITQMDSDPRVTAFKLDHGRLFGPSFLADIMNLPITLKEIQKYTAETDPEYRRLDKVIKMVKKLIDKFNLMQARATRIREVANLANSLIWRGREAQIDFSAPERALIKQGQVSKKRDMWLNLYLYLILFDNYILITDEIKDAPGRRFKVTEEPIALSFLLVEIAAGTEFGATDTGNAGDTVFYPFKIRNISIDELYTFYTNLAQERQEWLTAVQEAQAKFFAQVKLHEPFSLRCILDAAFSHDKEDVPHKLPIYPKNSVLDLALQEVSAVYPGKLPMPLMYSKVNVTETFTRDGKRYTLVGLGYGVFMSETTQVRGWVRVLELRSVTQLKVLEEFNVVVVLADRVLQYYRLDSLFAVFKGTANKTIGQKLSKQYVSFFKVGHQKGLTLLFYCKQKVLSSGYFFKVMVPKFDDASGTMEHFEEHRKFNIQAECYNLTIFNNTFLIHTVKGLEILLLSILQPQSIPVLTDARKIENANVEMIRKKLMLALCKPMGLFKINENKELLLVYTDFAIICNNHGFLSRYNILQFTFKCHRVAFQDDHLIIVGKNIIEIFKIDNNTCAIGATNYDKPVQVISAKDITMVDDTPGSITFSVLHPSQVGRQLIVELVRNE